MNRNKWKWKHTTPNLWDSVKAVLRGRFTAKQAYHKKQEKIQINNLTIHLKQLEKEEMKHPRVNQFSSVQLLSRVWLFATPWIAARQASLSITNSQSLLRLTSIESVMPSSHLILCHPLSSWPQSLPAPESFPMSQVFVWGGQSTGVSALASFLPKKSQG